VLLSMHYLATGLQIARWARLDLSPELDGWVSWRKVYRTLVFLEWYGTPALQEGQKDADVNVPSWLAASLGYQFDLSESEIEVRAGCLRWYPDVDSLDSSPKVTSWNRFQVSKTRFKPKLA
jgi:hypothetical protein